MMAKVLLPRGRLELEAGNGIFLYLTSRIGFGQDMGRSNLVLKLPSQPLVWSHFSSKSSPVQSSPFHFRLNVWWLSLPMVGLESICCGVCIQSIGMVVEGRVIRIQAMYVWSYSRAEWFLNWTWKRYSPPDLWSRELDMKERCLLLKVFFVFSCCSRV